jgi:hypothetical protein
MRKSVSAWNERLLRTLDAREREGLVTGLDRLLDAILETTKPSP